MPHPLRSTLALASCLAAGCSTPAPTADAPPAPILGMANPASVFCVQQGGTLQLHTTAQGSVGMCALPDGTVIEEWALYRKHHP